MRRRWILIAIVAAAVLASGIAWEVASPWLTLKGMRDAARASDSDRLASYVDFVRVRADLRRQVIRHVDGRFPGHSLEAVVARKGVRLVVDPIVDVIVSPESLKVALEFAPKSEGSGAAKQPCGMKREDLSHFRVRCAQLPNGLGDLKFERQGFGWKMVGIDLLDDYGARIP